MSEPKLKAKLWVHATLRRCTVEGLFATVVHKGDDDAGTVLVKVNRGREAGCDVYTQVRDRDGQPAWLRATGAEPVPEDKADAYIARARDIDYDVWVIEVESRDGAVAFIDRLV